MNPVMFSFFGYLFILVLIGLFFRQKQSNTTDFFVGNRKLNFWLTALNAHASDMSAWLFMAFPAACFAGGVPQCWIAFGLTLGMFLNWHIVAKKLRLETEKYGSCTLSTFFEKRFEDHSGYLRHLTSIISVFFLTAYLSAGMIGMGHLYASIFQVNYYLSLGVATVAIVVYVFFGGFMTVAWTDFFQGIFLLLVILIVPVVAFLKIGGWNEVITAAHAQNLSLSLLPHLDFKSFLSILFLASWGLGYLGQPHIITKFMGIENANDIYKSKYLGMTWQILALGAAGMVGLISIAYFPNGLQNTELVFVELVKKLFQPGFTGIILTAIIAANISTMGSQILVCASSLTEDFYKYYFKEKATPKKLLQVSRVSIVIVATVSLFFAYHQNSTIMGVVQYAWAGLGCSFGPLVFLSLYSTRVNRFGAISGVITGSGFAAFWPFLNPYLTHYEMTSMIPGFFMSLAVSYFVSLFTKNLVLKDVNP